jgi:hypothetical protein
VDLKNIRVAKAEAEEFVRRCEVIEKDLAASSGGWISPKAGGALRRQSMELTRALAEMRKPQTYDIA